MAYKDSSYFTHTQQDKVGLLITNLGTPDAPTTKAVRRYLKEFLSDPRVVEMPRLLWWFMLNGVILNIRPSRSAKAYKKVWTEEGSPLAVHTEKQARLLHEKLKQTWGDNILVEHGMRYGSPSIESALQKLIEQGARKLLVMPMYPQYSGSTTASTFDAIAKDFGSRRLLPEFRFINSYHDFGPYIEALASSIRQYWEDNGRAQMLLFSYHGLPMNFLHNGDPYHCHCHKTSRLLAAALGLKDDEWTTAFQSRMGREPWLQPYANETLKSFPDKGIKSVQVVCPGFPADCLETIEEIGMENREYFMEAGGEKYQYIPSLNEQDIHIDALAQLAEKHLGGWREDYLENSSSAAASGCPASRSELFKAHSYNQKSET